MSLVPMTLDVIKKALPTLEPAGCTSRLVLSLGYPDILAGPDQIAQIFGDAVAAKLEYRTDSAKILRYHGAGHMADRVVEADALFRALGYELEVIDLHAARGGEILHDLNEPLPAHLHQRYAMVLDAGTLEHCFNIAQAVVNVASAVALGGIVMHGNPLTMFNHGFYNLNPVWYHDFYSANGFVIERLHGVIDQVSASPRISTLPPYKRFTNIPDNAVIVAVARRTSLAPLRYPIQTKYRDNPTLSG